MSLGDPSGIIGVVLGVIAIAAILLLIRALDALRAAGVAIKTWQQTVEHWKGAAEAWKEACHQQAKLTEEVLSKLSNVSRPLIREIPPVLCPACEHSKSRHVIDGYSGKRICSVIGCLCSLSVVREYVG